MDATSPVEQVRDVVNVDELQGIVAQIGHNKSKPFRLWLKRNLRNYLVREHSDTRLVVPGSLRSIIQALAPEKLGSIHFVNVAEAPAWLVTKINAGADLIYVSVSEEFISHINHLYDYVDAEFKGDLARASYQELVDSAEDWMRRLARQKIREGLREALDIVWNDDDHMLVHLLTKEEYQLEGKVMHNCVGGSYFSRLESGTHIFSYRDVDNTSIYTIEATLREIEGTRYAMLVQIKGVGSPDLPDHQRRNRLPSKDEKDRLFKDVCFATLHDKNGIPYVLFPEPAENVPVPSVFRDSYEQMVGIVTYCDEEEWENEAEWGEADDEDEDDCDEDDCDEDDCDEDDCDEE